MIEIDEKTKERIILTIFVLLFAIILSLFYITINQENHCTQIINNITKNQCVQQCYIPTIQGEWNNVLKNNSINTQKPSN